MKNKNLFIVGLCIALLVTGCKDVFGPPKQEKPNVGKGYFSLAIDGARTIMPSDALEQFAGGFTLDFAAVDGDGTDQSVYRTYANRSVPVELYAGTYTLHVTAYTEYTSASNNKPVATGELPGIVINGEELTTNTITLRPIADNGTGTFKWDIKFADDVSDDLTTATMTITPLNGGSDEQTKDFIETPADKADSLTLDSGYYRILVKLQTANGLAEQWETLHVYQNMESFYEFTFAEKHFSPVVFVTNGDNTGEGSLRQAITDVPAGGRIVVKDDVKTIALSSPRLEITRSMIIEGNSVTVTRASTWTTVDDTSQMMYVNGTGIEVTIRRVMFKDGRSTNYGAAIRINAGTVNLESCIFSGNQCSGGIGYGGAIYIYGSASTMNVKACTFYNTSSSSGGAIYMTTSPTVTLTGNLFYGNTATYGPVVNGSSSTLKSNGYNAVDVDFGTGSAQNGFAAATGDKKITGLPVSATSFNLLAASGAANVIPTPPSDYPAEDFYGTAIENGAAAGAVQGSTANGYYLGLSVNNSAASISATPTPDADGIVPAGTVTITAAAEGYELRWWLVDGIRTPRTGTNTFQLSVTKHTIVQAVFGKVVLVTNANDTGAGSLRQAITSAQDGDVIRIETASQTIQLGSRLSISKNIAIEGNGVTITPNATMAAAPSATSQLMNIESKRVVTISRVWFKDGNATGSGGAINNGGVLTLESCIFTGNKSNYGGAIYNSGTTTSGGQDGILNSKNCTFYNNSASISGGVFYYNAYSCVITLTGNLFFGNTATSGYPILNRGSYGVSRSNGYNVVDVTLGDANTQSGFANSAGNDKTVAVTPVSLVNFRLTRGSEAANLIPVLPNDYPAEDFYGDPVTVGAAAGAVQGTVSSSGYGFTPSVNDKAYGSVSTTATPNAEGLYSGTVTVTATPVTNYVLVHWLVNGKETASTSTNSIQLTLEDNTSVRAVFGFAVTDFSDATGSATVAGRLRWAMTNAKDGDFIYVSGTPGVSVIELTSRLPGISSSSITIEGNGITITRDDSYAEGTNTPMMYISGSNTTIRRVWFKDGRSQQYSAAINKSGGALTLESCIFSGNQTGSSGVYAYAGPIFSEGSLNVKGCTFISNSSTGSGAICTTNRDNITLTGNLFYGNTGGNSNILWRRNTSTTNGTVTTSYNVVDVAFGTNTTQSGFAAGTGDKRITNWPVSPTSLRLLSGSEAANVITILPADYPTADFYGDPITAGAAAGAVQSTVSGSGYFLNLSVNNSARGSVSSSQLNSDGIASSNAVTITATAPATGYALKWLVDGIQTPGTTSTTLQLTLTKNTFVQAFYYRELQVTSTDDTGAGSLRQAITDAQAGDIISLSGVTAGVTTITLASTLPTINKNITIEGNGVILTSSMTASSTSRMMLIEGPSTEVTISRVWFKDGSTTAGGYGGAISKNEGNLTLESCVFSGNRTDPSASNSYGGAIYNAAGTLNVTGCTFVSNSGGNGGAIYVRVGTLALTGNLFYGNTTRSSSYYGPVVRGGTVTSYGYNVVDVALGTADNQSGFAATTGDKTIATILGNNATTPFADTDTLAPKSELSNTTNGIPAATWTVGTGETATTVTMPATDFYGEERTWPGAMGAVR